MCVCSTVYNLATIASLLYRTLKLMHDIITGCVLILHMHLHSYSYLLVYYSGVDLEFSERDGVDISL